MELVERLLKAFYNIYQDPKYLNPRGIPGIVLAVKAGIVDSKNLRRESQQLLKIYFRI